MKHTDKLEINVAIQIQKPASQIFEAIVNPDKMSGYFISQSTGRLEENKTVMWRFPEFDMEFPVRGGRMDIDKYISYYWESGGQDLIVEMTLTAVGKGATVVRVTEKSMDNNPAGIQWLKGNTEGWANFLACLKAYLEFGINLRKGGFDFRKDEFNKLSK